MEDSPYLNCRICYAQLREGWYSDKFPDYAPVETHPWRCPYHPAWSAPWAQTHRFTMPFANPNVAGLCLSANLKEWVAGDRQLMEVPTAVLRMSCLTRLVLSKNQITALPDDLGELTSLTVLNVGYNRLQRLPSTLALLSNLRVLNVGYNQLTALPDHIGNMKSLTHLYAANNKISRLPDSLADIHCLQYISVAGNKLMSLPARCLSPDTLEILDIGGNQLTEIPAWLGEMIAVSTLGAGGNELSRDGLPCHWGNLTSTLENLGLGGNKLTSLPDSVAQLQNLELLCLSKVTLPARQAHIHPSLVPHSNSLTELPDWLPQLQRLDSLYAGNNYIGFLPNNFGQLRSLTFLDLNGNLLSDLPESFGELSNLVGCYMKGNNLQLLPSTLGQLTKLTHLDVSHNELTELPKSFVDLISLQWCDLRVNRLGDLPKAVLDLGVIIGSFREEVETKWESDDDLYGCDNAGASGRDGEVASDCQDDENDDLSETETPSDTSSEVNHGNALETAFENDVCSSCREKWGSLLPEKIWMRNQGGYLGDGQSQHQQSNADDSADDSCGELCPPMVVKFETEEEKRESTEFWTLVDWRREFMLPPYLRVKWRRGNPYQAVDGDGQGSGQVSQEQSQGASGHVGETANDCQDKEEERGDASEPATSIDPGSQLAMTPGELCLICRNPMKQSSPTQEHWDFGSQDGDWGSDDQGDGQTMKQSRPTQEHWDFGSQDGDWGSHDQGDGQTQHQQPSQEESCDEGRVEEVAQFESDEESEEICDDKLDRRSEKMVLPEPRLGGHDQPRCQDNQPRCQGEASPPGAGEARDKGCSKDDGDNAAGGRQEKGRQESAPMGKRKEGLGFRNPPPCHHKKHHPAVNSHRRAAPANTFRYNPQLRGFFWAPSDLHRPSVRTGCPRNPAKAPFVPEPGQFDDSLPSVIEDGQFDDCSSVLEDGQFDDCSSVHEDGQFDDC